MGGNYSRASGPQPISVIHVASGVKGFEIRKDNATVFAKTPFVITVTHEEDDGNKTLWIYAEPLIDDFAPKTPTCADGYDLFIGRFANDVRIIRHELRSAIPLPPLASSNVISGAVGDSAIHGGGDEDAAILSSSDDDEPAAANASGDALT